MELPVNKIIRKIPLKDKLDEIDELTEKKVGEGYYQSCLAAQWGMWEKGKVVAGRRGGGVLPPSYRQIEKETGRGHVDLKKWNDLYEKYPTKKLYLPVIVQNAKTQTQAWLEGEKKKYYQLSESIEWATPQWLFDLLDNEFHFTLDVCATIENAKCKKFYTKEQNGLNKSWTGICWMNPPYGREISDWMNKAKESARKGATIVCLIPARPDTDWWWENALEGEIRFIHHRLKWPGSNTIAPFPSAVVVLGKNVKPRKVVWWEISKSN